MARGRHICRTDGRDVHKGGKIVTATRIHIGVAFATGWKEFKSRPGFWVPLTTAYWLIAALPQAAPSFLMQQLSGLIGLAISGIAWIIGVYLVVIISQGMLFCVLLTTKGIRPGFKDLFVNKFSFKFFLMWLILSLLYTIAFVSVMFIVWFLLDFPRVLERRIISSIILIDISVILSIGAHYMLCRLAPSAFVMIERKNSLYASMRAGLRLTYGATFKIFLFYAYSVLLIGFSFVPCFIMLMLQVGPITLIDTVFTAMPSVAVLLVATSIIFIAFANIYRQLKQAFVFERLSISSSNQPA